MATLACESCPQVKIFQIGTDDSWQLSRCAPTAVDEICRDNSLNLIFSSARKIRECKRCCHHYSTVFKIPSLYWTEYCRGLEGYFGCDETCDDDGNIDGYDTWFRFLVKQILETRGPDGKNYAWHKINIFTRWTKDGKTSILIFDHGLSPDFEEKVKKLISENLKPHAFDDPYWFHAIVLEELIRLQDIGVWSIRDSVRDIETDRTSTIRPDPDYHRLHDVARHAIHVSESLDLAMKSITDMISQHEQFSKDNSHQEARRRHVYRRVGQRLQFFYHMLQSLKYRSESNKERLSNEVNLAFHTVAQYDSKISVQIGQAAQRDSSAMRTISVMTLTFLPATFISTIFSTTFFSFQPSTNGQPEHWYVSESFWIFWAFALPLTAVIVAFWRIWPKLFPTEEVGANIRLPGRVGTRETMNVLLRSITARAPKNNSRMKHI